MTHVTCRLTGKNRDQLRNRVRATFTFLYWKLEVIHRLARNLYSQHYSLGGNSDAAPGYQSTVATSYYLPTVIHLISFICLDYLVTFED